MPPPTYALAIIGAGPVGLAILHRLVREARDGVGEARRLLSSTLVVDSSGGWLMSWRRKLGSQGVAHLRSPTFVHPHASRIIDDELLEFARRSGRASRLDELRPVECNGWRAPSCELFDDFCEAMLREVQDFGGAPAAAVLTAWVSDIVPLADADGGGLELRLDGGAPVHVGQAVLAVGDGFAARLPRWHAAAAASHPEGARRIPHASDLAALHPCAALGAGRDEPAGPARRRCRAVLHAVSHLAARLADLLAARRCGSRALRWIRLAQRWCRGGAAEPHGPCGGGRLVVVGGGLSSAQLCLLAARRGWRKVTLCSRAALAVRPFDLEKGWMERHFSVGLRPFEEDFFSASPPERRRLIAAARPGGSVTPRVLRELRRLERRGGVELWEGALVQRAVWRGAGGEWELDVRSESLGAKTLRADAVWVATGHALECGGVAPLQTLRALRAQREHDGLPELTPELRWDERTPLYVAGALTALQIGPDAFNLAGAGLSAARVVSDLIERARPSPR